MDQNLLIHIPLIDRQWLIALEEIEAGSKSPAELCTELGISNATLYRRLKRAREVRSELVEPVPVTPGEDAVHLEIVQRPPLPSEDRGGGWYALNGDRTSQDDKGGMITITDGDGRRVLRLPMRAGRITKTEEEQAEEKSAEEERQRLEAEARERPPRPTSQLAPCGDGRIAYETRRKDAGLKGGIDTG